MAQASLAMAMHGGQTEVVDTDEEDGLLGPEGGDSVRGGLVEPVETSGPTDAPMDTVAATTTHDEDTRSVSDSVVNGMAAMKIPTGTTTAKKTDSSSSKMTNPPPPTPQYYQGKDDPKPLPLPFMMRTLVNLTTLMAAWVAGTYECPYPGCLWASQGTRKDDGSILRPDRWSDFLEHWYCLHMVPCLLMRCTIEGCNNASRIFTCSRRMSEHVRGHFKERKGHDEESRKPLKLALETFSANAGAEPDMKALQRTIVYPAHHLTRKQYDMEKKAKAERELKVEEEKERKSREKKDTKREEDRKSRHATSSSQKRDHSASTSSSYATAAIAPDTPHIKKIKTEIVAESLTVRHYDRSISMECLRQITGSFGALNMIWKTNCHQQMNAAEEKMCANDRDKAVVCKEVDRVRGNLNKFRDDVDVATSHMAYWQEDLGSTPAAIPPNKMLLCPSVLSEARTVPALKEKLATARSTVDKISTDLKEVLSQLDIARNELKDSKIREKGLEERLAAMEIAATPLPPATFGGETTFLNRPTTRNEIALFQAQIARMHEYWGQFH